MLVRWVPILSSLCCLINAGPLGTYPILSVLPDKFARVLFQFHCGRFESVDLPILPDDRSQFDVHGALKDETVFNTSSSCYFIDSTIKQVNCVGEVFNTCDAHD
jgi:hypothetical protein